jgi:glycosyltransferase involved in cell wall biosynthesis
MQFSTSAPPTQRRSSTVASASGSDESQLISVVVPTCDRPTALAACLAALGAQTVLERLEVVVVDDGSSGADGVAAVTARFSHARLLRQEHAGPAAARNAGARAALGEVICFTDDDCVPEPDWTERLAQAIEQGADVVAGRTLNSGGALAEAAELIAWAPAAAQPFAPSNNLGCRASVLRMLPFDESYPDAAAEDRDWCVRITAAGHLLRVEPAARLIHRQELTLERFLRRQLRYGRGAYRFRRGTGGRLQSPAFYVALLRTAFARGAAVGALVSIAQVVCALGFASAWAADRRDGRRAQVEPRRQT